MAADPDAMVRCLFVGARIQEEAFKLLLSAQGLLRPGGGRDEETGRSLVRSRISSLDRLMRRAESCGVEHNGLLGGSFASLLEASRSGDPGVLADSARQFAGDIRSSADYALDEETSGTLMPSGPVNQNISGARAASSYGYRDRPSISKTEAPPRYALYTGPKERDAGIGKTRRGLFRR